MGSQRRVCTICGVPKPSRDFYPRGDLRSKSRLRSECIECTKAKRRAYVADNLSVCVARTRKRRAAIQAILVRIKAERGCKECPERDPICLEFHHRDPTKKTTRLSQVGREGWGNARLVAEVEKCDVLCANCHRKLHHKTSC